MSGFADSLPCFVKFGNIKLISVVSSSNQSHGNEKNSPPTEHKESRTIQQTNKRNLEPTTAAGAAAEEVTQPAARIPQTTARVIALSEDSIQKMVGNNILIKGLLPVKSSSRSRVLARLVIPFLPTKGKTCNRMDEKLIRWIIPRARRNKWRMDADGSVMITVVVSFDCGLDHNEINILYNAMK